jgi:nucleotide-binding universal stress UspA family protein
MNRILACIDLSAYAVPVCDLAAWAAERLEAPIEILHVVQRSKSAVAERHDLSGAIGLGVKTELLEELTRIDEAQSRLSVERGRILLSGAAERLREAGPFTVHTTHRHGGIVETILEREAEARLLVIGKRGTESEFAREHLGSKVERVIRASKLPVMVAPRETVSIKRVLLAYDGSASAKRALDFVGCSRLFEGLPIEIVTVGHSDKDAGILGEAEAALEEAGRPADSVLVDGRAESALKERATAQPGTLLVMGAYGHSRLRRLVVGSTTTEMIRTVGLPVLLIR